MSDTGKGKRDLTRGGIVKTILTLALPIAGSQLLQMLYNFTDMFWLGRLSGEAVAASGTAGLFLWLSVGLMLVGKVGTEIGVSQSRGRGDEALALRFARSGLYISAILGLAYAAFMGLLRGPLVALFRYRESSVAAEMASYMGLMAIGIPFQFVGAAVGGIFGASGNTRTPFFFNLIGLGMNLIIDPLLIFNCGLGIEGAAVASIASEVTVAAQLCIALKRSKRRPFEAFAVFPRPRSLRALRDELRGVAGKFAKWTIPIFLESTLFCLLTMVTSGFEVSVGAYAVTVSRVGTQVESLSWLVGGGFGSALTIFVGQNYGAGRYDRIAGGVKRSAFIMAGWGLAVTAVLALGGEAIYRFFLPEDAELWGLGVRYMRILAISQIPMNLESVFGNAFKGQGRTIPPSVSSISSNVVRVPLAYILSRTSLGLTGIWLAVTITAAMRGIWIGAWYGISGRPRRGRAEGTGAARA